MWRIWSFHLLSYPNWPYLFWAKTRTFIFSNYCNFFIIIPLSTLFCFKELNSLICLSISINKDTNFYFFSSFSVWSRMSLLNFTLEMFELIFKLEKSIFDQTVSLLNLRISRNQSNSCFFFKRQIQIYTKLILNYSTYTHSRTWTLDLKKRGQYWIPLN